MALADLRRNGQRTATRASVTNLVLVAADGHEVSTGCDAVHRLGRRHPGRNIVLLPLPDAAPDGIDAEVVLHGSLAEGHPVWSEDIRLDVRGVAASHLDSLVEPLTLADLPVAVWFVSGVPVPEHPLLRAATTVLVDTEGLADGGLTAIVRLARRRVVVDLCWTRLRPWRQLLAGLFDVPACRPFLSGVRRVEVRGPASQRLLLAGWLSSRLALLPPALALTPADAPAVAVVAEHEGTIATFTVELARGGRGPGTVRAVTDLAGSGLREDRLTLPDDPLAWSLGEGLARAGRDRVHGQAVHAAVGLPS